MPSALMTLLKEQAESPIQTDPTFPKVSLVVPPSPFTVPRGWLFVLYRPFEGVSYISTVLKNAGYPVRIIDVRKSPDPIGESLAEAVKDTDILGIATFEDSFPFLEELTRRVKEERPDLPIILGGSLVTSVPEAVMHHTRANIAVLGEGELTILQLMPELSKGNLMDLQHIPGLCYRNREGRLSFTKSRFQMRNLDSLPVMNLSLWPGVQKNPTVKEILTSHSRGCYNNCSFCYRTTPRLSLKSPGKLYAELSVLKRRHNFEFIYFVDLTFAIDKKRTEEICEVVKGFNVKWSCMSRVQHLDAPLLQRMREAGCEIILYGYESLDQNVLDRADKRITPQEIERTIRLTEEAGIQAGGLFIVGLPGETRESLKKLISFTRKLRTPIRVKYLSAIPGTEIYRSGLSKGIIKSEVEHLRFLARERCQKNDEFLNFTDLPDQELRQAYLSVYRVYAEGPRTITDPEFPQQLS